MSLNLESPLSDSKMDISDTTTSQEESPLGEEEGPVIKLPTLSSIHISNHNEPTNPSPEVIQNHTHNEDDLNSDLLQLVSSELDNRLPRPEVLSLELTPQRHTIERTLANNSHPLMSPGESDSEHYSAALPPRPTAASKNDVKCHNFPDVVPHYERLQPLLQSNTVTARNTLNNQIRGLGVKKGLAAVTTIGPTQNKLLLRAHSPDLLSSESDAEISQYHATVGSNFQAVALVPTNNSGATQKDTRRTLRKVTGNAVTSDAAVGAVACNTGAVACDDISSLDSISNHSFEDDEDLEHNLASLSPSSSLIDGLDDDDSDDGGVDDDDFVGTTTPTPLQHVTGAVALSVESTAAITTNDGQLPQYSAAEERRDSRNWQKITLPDGRTREIDMRVIEPYKRVLSHGGYLKAGGHNAIVIFCACHLPDRSRADYSYVMDNLFLYVVKTLEQLVTEDYVLIYLHGGTSRRNMPPFPWLKKCYQLLDRRLRKSLKNMYLVHPTFWIKSIVWMARPFVSAKFWRKLIYVKSLDELAKHVTVEKAAIPEKVKQYDAKHN